MENWLNERLVMGLKYEVPVYSSPSDESEELVKGISGLNFALKTAQ
jgi:hypothetical protein